VLRIDVIEEGKAPALLAFDDARRVTFGRSQSNDIVLSAEYISRSHGEFRCEDGRWFVVDLGSQAGLVLVEPNAPDHPIELIANRPEMLSGGEQLRIRDTRMGIEIKSGPSSSQDDDSQWLNLKVSRVAEGELSDAAVLQKELERDSHKLNLLLDLSRELTQLDSLEDVFDHVSQTVFKSLPSATHFTVCAPTSEDDYTPQFAVTRDGSSIPAEQIKVSHSILDLAVEHERAMLFRLTDGEAPPSQSVVLNSIASAMAIPLRGPSGIQGVMMVDNRSSAAPFGTQDLDFSIVLGHHVAAALQRTRYQSQIKGMFDGFVDASVTAIEARDATTSGHSRRVADFSIALCEAVSLAQSGPFAKECFSDDDRTELAYAALLHDFGKVAVRECVLLKANRLYPEQLERIETRFQLISERYANTALRHALKTGVGSLSPTEALDRVTARTQAFAEQLDGALALIRGINSSRPLSEEEADRVHAIAAMRFEDPVFGDSPYLRADEFEALQIRRGTLSDEEREEIQAHVTHSYESLRRIPWPSDLRKVPDIVHMHHEKIDGSGYPRGIDGEQIPIEVRLLTVCDIFDALTASDRPYRSAMPLEQGLDQLRTEAGRGQIDSNLVELFIETRVWNRPEPDPTTTSLLRRSNRAAD
jgi:HD-GYP domain-containing protein (c-di-GMP phosphodiesterase class II)